MKKIIIILITVLPVFNSCNDREDVFSLSKSAPEVKIMQKGGEMESYNDSIKLDTPLYLNYKIISDEELILSHRVITGDYTIKISSGNVEIISKKEGTGKIELYTINSEQKRGVASVELRTFDNLPPICKVNINVINPDHKDVEIDASSSKDKDEKFGGKLIEYEYQVDDLEKIITSEKKLRQVLRFSGQRKIKVRCKDNNNEWSELYETTVTL